MARYRLTRQAEKDYREILEFTLGQWGIPQFEKYARSLDSAFERLLTKPQLGTQCNNIRPGYFRYRMGQHYIFYRINQDVLEIARILHVRRNIKRQLLQDLED
jgi:toxin ParE1/3/4